MITQKEILQKAQRERALELLGLSKINTYKGVNR